MESRTFLSSPGRGLQIFPLAFTATKELTSFYEISDDIILIDLEAKNYFANERDDYIKNLVKVIQKDGYEKAKSICNMCPRDEKCGNFIKESLKQLAQQQPCLTVEEEAKEQDKRVAIWFDQIFYKTLEKDIKAQKKAFSPKKKK